MAKDIFTKYGNFNSAEDNSEGGNPERGSRRIPA